MRALIASDPGIFESLQKYYKYLQFYIFVSKLLCTMYVSGDLEVQYMKRLPTTFLKASEMLKRKRGCFLFGSMIKEVQNV